MNDLAKRLVVAVIIFFLVALTYVKIKEAAAADAENERLTLAAAAIADTVTIWRDRFHAADTVLQRQLVTIDSFASRTGPIRWRTVRDTIVVIEPGTTVVDTVVVTDSIAVIEGDSAVHIIPTVVALELQECRLLTETCAEYKHTADSTIKWQATHIDTLTAQIDNLDRRVRVPELAIFGLDLPLPSVTAGYGVMYSMKTCDDSGAEFVKDDVLVIVENSCDKIHHGFTLGLTWNIWSP